MYFRRNTALALSALVLAAPALSSCGFNYATDIDYTPAAGVHNRDAVVDVLGAVVVSAQDGSGTFIASLSNNDQREPMTFDFLAGSGGTTLTAEEFEAISIARGGFVNLAEEGGIELTGEFGAGDFVPLTVGFGNGERVTLQVPVVDDSGIYDGLDSSGNPADDEDDAATIDEAGE
ncbi:hypothetical protein [Nocardioides sp.]|uniref:hypothetical protein n=1 Tax=Nocardioides sp. TaxID=35761 RepID=UPI0035637EC1